MATQRSQTRPLLAERLRAANRRTGALLSTIAFVFFVGVIVSHYLGGVTAGLAVLGVAIVLYLAVAIGRSVGNRK
jgi:uncharacterized membrane protein YoaK (UPF0700 family)